MPNEAEDEIEDVIKFPDRCPKCNSQLQFGRSPKSGTFAYCQGDDCEWTQVEKPPNE